MPSSSSRKLHILTAAALLPEFPFTGISERALFALVEMFMTTSTAEFPGVTGVDGLKTHWAPAGSPALQARVTAPLKDEPMGRTLSA
jgi:hypothetical protein